MALNIRFEMLDTGIAKITLAGELDASTAPQFQKEVEKAAQQKARRLALVVTDLEYICQCRRFESSCSQSRRWEPGWTCT